MSSCYTGNYLQNYTLSQPRKPPSEYYSYLTMWLVVGSNTASTVFWDTNLKELKITDNPKGGTVPTLVSNT
jgi:hypothetical protein